MSKSIKRSELLIVGMKENGIFYPVMSPRHRAQFIQNYSKIENYWRDNNHPSLDCVKFSGSNSDSSDHNNNYLKSTYNNPNKRLTKDEISCKPKSVHHH